jgi:hypothetical protein
MSPKCNPKRDICILVQDLQLDLLEGEGEYYFPYPGVNFLYCAHQELGSLDFVESSWRESFPQNKYS